MRNKAVGLAMMLLAGPLWAETRVDIAVFADSLPENLREEIAESGNTRFLQRAAQILFSQSPEDGILTRDRLQLARQMRRAEQRAQYLSPILSFDLDGDFQLSRHEYESQIARFDHRTKAQLALLFAAKASDLDVAVTLEEFVETFPYEERSEDYERAERLLKFDYSGDGKVDLAEIAQVIVAIKERPAIKVTPEPSCTAPAVTPGASVVLLSGGASQALSVVALAGSETPTYAATVVVEPGDVPLYVFAVAQRPMVWHFTGATQRVHTLVVQQPAGFGEGLGAAVMGLPADRVTFVGAGACLEIVPTRMGQSLNAAADALSAALQFRVASMVTSGDLTEMMIPSGDTVAERDKPSERRARYAAGMEIRLRAQTYRLSGNGMVLLDENGQPKVEPTTDRTAIQDMVRVFPAGIANADPSTLVAPRMVDFYQVLPGEAGLLQLLAEGKIKPSGDGKYLVIAPIPAFPAGKKGLLTFAEGITPPNPLDRTEPSMLDAKP